MDVIIKRETAKTGVDILKVNEFYLHSKYDPLREAQQKLKNEYKPHHLHIVFGYGLGYLVDALIEMFHFNEPILVIDPLLSTGDITVKKSEYNRLYCVGADDTVTIVNLIDKLSSYSHNVHIITSMNYDKLFPMELKQVLQIVKNNHYKQGSNLATAKYFASVWQKNLLLNTPALVADSSLHILKHAYNAPIVIAAGGPSLIKQLPLLKQYREQVILICAGSTINALLNNDVYPDYVVSVDGGIDNAHHFEQLHLDEHISLMYGPTNHPKVRESFSGECYGFVPAVKPQYMDYFKKRFSKELMLVDGGGSVAHYALSIADFITIGPIALIGQDLALTGNQTHAEGVKSNKNIETLQQKDIVSVEGYYGDEVVTTHTMNIMINSFNEPPLTNMDRKNVWNCTEGGAKIKTIQQMPFEQFLQQFAAEHVEKVKLVSTKSNSVSLKAYVQKELQEYKKVGQLFEKGIQVIEKSTGYTLAEAELRKIGDIEKHLNASYKRLSMETLLEPIFDRCSQQYLPKINETAMESKIRAKAYALDLYTSSLNQLNTFIEEINLQEN